MTLTEYFKNKLALLAEITEKDYKIQWDAALMIISEADSGRVVKGNSKPRTIPHFQTLLSDNYINFNTIKSVKVHQFNFPTAYCFKFTYNLINNLKTSRTYHKLSDRSQYLL